MFKYVVTGCLLAGYGFYHYMGFNKAKYFTEKSLPSQILIYKPNVGEYAMMTPTFDEIRQAFKDFKGNFVMTGIFLDNPETVKDHHQERALIGALVDPSQKHHVEEFLAKHPEYRVKDTKDMPAIASEEIPYRNPISFMWGVRKLYTKILKYGIAKKIFEGDDILGGVELYYPRGKGYTIEILVPYGKDAAELHKATAPVADFERYYE